MTPGSVPQTEEKVQDAAAVPDAATKVARRTDRQRIRSLEEAVFGKHNLPPDEPDTTEA